MKMKLPFKFSMGYCLCLYGCIDQGKGTRLATKIWNLTDRPIDLQIRVGSVLKKAYTLKPGSSKRLNCNSIYRTYMSDRIDSLLYDEDMCQPYVWVHDGLGGLCRSRVVKQQYISMQDLRDSLEIKIFRDNQRGCIVVHKRPTPNFC